MDDITKTMSKIIAVGTAVPKYRFSQKVLLDFMLRYMDHDEASFRKTKALFKMSGISYRYSVLPDFDEGNGRKLLMENTGQRVSTTKRNEIYLANALDLCKKAINDMKIPVHVLRNEITHVIAVSCTGLYAPGLEKQIMLSLGLPNSTEVYGINFMGCFAAFHAVKHATDIVGNRKNSRVLIVCVELCSLHIQHQPIDDFLLSNSLFGDGAAAIIVANDAIFGHQAFEIAHFKSLIFPEHSSGMTWKIGDFGFQMALTSKIPDHIKQCILSVCGVLVPSVTDFSDFLIATHPGGKKIISAVDEALGLVPSQNNGSRRVLRNFGNMSSCSILFVLKDILACQKDNNDKRKVLSFAFGPGLTVEGMVLNIL